MRNALLIIGGFYSSSETPKSTFSKHGNISIRRSHTFLKKPWIKKNFKIE